MLLITGLMGLSSLCVLIKALRFGAMGFICSRYFCCFLFIIVLHLCIVEFVFEMILWDLCFLALFDSLVWRYRSFVLMCLSVLWPWFCLYQLLLPLDCSVPKEFLFVLDFIGVFYVVCYVCLCQQFFLIFLIVMYLNVFYIVMSKCLIAFSVSYYELFWVLVYCILES